MVNSLESTKMKITKFKSWTENLELTRPYTIAYKTIDTVEIIFVRINAEDELFGLGSASPAEFITGENFEDCRRALEKYPEELLLGQDIRFLSKNCRSLKEKMSAAPAAMAAVDMALYDLMAKYLKVPLVDFLGRVHKSLPTSITIGIMSVEEALKDAQEYLDRGFRILKVKVGKSIEEDLEVLHKLREKVRNSAAIRIDANQGYSITDLKKFIKKTEPLDIEFMEQPLKADNTGEML